MVKTGLDILPEQDFAPLTNKNIGLLVHPASVNRRLEHAIRIFTENRVRIQRLFGPQHGILGQTQDNMIEWQGFRDPATGTDICSLYGEHRKPLPEMLEGIDTFVIDLQDVGARYYTFVWTMLLCMEACAENNVTVLVLDRPNPIGCSTVEGPLLDPEYSSFVGMAPIPIRHGMTCGELAAYANAALKIHCDLEVIRMQGFSRCMHFEDTELPWVMPSPNMPTVDTAFVYPGFCLLEGTNISEGRGTTRPFEIFGAPFIRARDLAEKLGGCNLPGARSRPMHFDPAFQKWSGRLCGGIQVHVTDRKVFRPVRTAVTVLSLIRNMYPDDFAWKQPPYEYEFEKMPIDILAGGPDLRKGIDAGEDPLELAAGRQSSLIQFSQDIEPYMFYE